MSLKLITKNLIIKKPTKEDVNLLIEELNNWEISKWLVRVPYPYQFKDAIEWLKITEFNELSFNIYNKNILIGGISLDTKENSINPELGYWIGQKHWGHGYAYEACNALLKYIFLNTSVEIIYASHIVNNYKSKKILLKMGFIQIGNGKKYSIARKEEVEDVNYQLLKS